MADNSRRLTSIPEEGQQPEATSNVANTDTTSKSKRRWDTVKRVVKRLQNHTLQLVGLEHPQSVKEHQDVLQRSIVVGKVSKELPSDGSLYRCDRNLREAIIPHHSVSPGTTHSILRQMSVHPDEGPTVTPITRVTRTQDIEMDTFRRQPPRSIETSLSDTRLAHPTRIEHSISAPVKKQYSVEQPAIIPKIQTGRAEVAAIEPKPDMWKIAYLGIKFMKSQSQVQPKKEQYSFDVIADEDLIHEDKSALFNVTTPPSSPAPVSLEETDSPQVEFGRGQSDNWARQTSEYTAQKYMFDDDDFFGHEICDADLEFQDGKISRRPPEYSPMSEIPPPDYSMIDRAPQEAPEIGTGRRQKKKLAQFFKFKRQYRAGPYLEGITFRLLNFRYKDVPESTRKKLEDLEKKSLYRPFFTYWLMTVHIIIMIFALSVYDFAPYGFDLISERALVQQSNLAVEVQAKNITPNVWLGPKQNDLVLLGAKYGPCMRADRQLLMAISNDVTREGSDSGCCVRKDRSGCVQVISEARCPSLFSDFVFTDPNATDGYTNRAVCGTAPRTCLNPDRIRDVRWYNNITEWPICLESQSDSSEHLSCNLTGRPCCVGIQAHCLITTLEHCTFLEGRFHSDAFLCSQVDCLGDVCGLLPFANRHVPDQFYRVATALFLHAGILHLLLTLLFDFFVLRHVEKYLGWLRTTIIYLGSGFGGNLVSIIFLPYNPEVGPTGSIFGVIAFFIIYIMYQAHRLKKPWLEAIKLLIIIFILLGCGLFPFIDNFAHIGGFIFGILLSGIVAPYYQPLDAELAYYRQKHKRDYDPKKDWIQITKYVFLGAGIPAVILLYTVFIVIFYVVQVNWDGFRYLNCIPFTSTFCLDYGQNIRSRDIFI